MLHDHEDIIKCLRTKKIKELTSYDFGAPSFLIAMGPSRDGILIPHDYANNNIRKRKSSRSSNYRVILGMVEDETSIFFSDSETREGMGPDTRDKYLRSLIRNTYTFHLNEIFATVQNEYMDWTSLFGGDEEINPRRIQWQTSRALTDKLYVDPILKSAKWLNDSGFQTYFYVYSHPSYTTVKLYSF